MRLALNQFLARVESIERIVALLGNLVEFGRLPSGTWDLVGANLHNSVRQIGQSGMQPVLDGCVLLLAAAFEQFVSDLMIAFTDDLPGIVPAYEDLPNAIRSHNEMQTGEALRNRGSRFTEYDLRRFVKNLWECHAGSRPYVLNGEAIALNDRNLSSGTLRDLISRLGMNDVWNAVASTATLQGWSGPGGPTIAGSRAQNQLNELIRNRNQVAHRVGGEALGPQAMLSFVRFKQALATSLVEALEDHSSNLVKS